MFKVIHAAYGNKDVTDIVRSYVDQDNLTIYVCNKILGDPTPNKKKYLVVTYSIDDKQKTATFEEDEWASLNEPGVASFCENNRKNLKELRKKCYHEVFTLLAGEREKGL